MKALTDQELDRISMRWANTGKGIRKLTFEEAHADMLSLLLEIKDLRPANRDLEARLKNAELLSKNMAQEMVREIEAVVRKYT